LCRPKVQKTHQAKASLYSIKRRKEEQMANIRIAVINASTVLTDDEVQAAVPALQTQVHRDFAPIWGIDAEEGLYMVADVDAQGQPLDGGRARYVLRFDAPPPVHAFWSITVYDVKTRLLVEHESGRYAVRDRDAGLQLGADGSLTLVLQHDAVSDGSTANWLPVPRRPFQLVARLYWPRDELLDGRYRPPAVWVVGATDSLAA